MRKKPRLLYGFPPDSDFSYEQVGGVAAEPLGPGNGALREEDRAATKGLRSLRSRRGALARNGA